MSYFNKVSSQPSREHVRVQPGASAPVRVDIMGNGFLEVLEARDISVGGLGISVHHNFVGYEIDSHVELVISLGGRPPFKTRGLIRHRSRAGNEHVFGVQFTDLAPKQRQAIETYVEQHLGQRALSPPPSSASLSTRFFAAVSTRWGPHGG